MSKEGKQPTSSTSSPESNSDAQQIVISKLITEARKHLIDFQIATNPQYQSNWHHDIIAKELEHIEAFGDRDYNVLLVFVPPRHGKSELCSIGFPAWYLGRNPEKEIITVSYSAELAQDFGGKTRGIVSGEVYPHIFNISLKEDEQAKAKWKTNKGGSYTSVGVGGAVTGRGANCFPSGTLIITERGSLPIERCNDRMRVLSYNHDSGIPEWKRIKGTLKRNKKGFTTITTTSGFSVKSTNDHPIFVFGRGYVEAQTIKKGERVRIFEAGAISRAAVFSMWERIYPSLVRIYQGNSERVQGFLLLKGMFRTASFFQAQQKMSRMWEKSIARAKVLFSGLYPNLPQAWRQVVQLLWYFIPSQISWEQVLFNGVQERFSFAGNDIAQSELQAWNGNGEISTRVSKKEISRKERPQQGMYRLQDEKQSSITSSGLQPKEQRRQKFGERLQKLSYNAPQIKEDAVSAVASTDEQLEVYDIEVEGNHNFFANGILAHNCLLFDDPIKNREEAESQIYRDKVWQFFTSTAFTRLEPKGVMVVILTRWHVDDLAGRILANPELSKRCKIIHFPAIATQKEIYRDIGDPLWPERFNLEALEVRKNTIGPYDWQSLYQGSPVLTENQEFKPHWFKHIPESQAEVLSMRRFLTVDTAMSKLAQADFTGFCDNRVSDQNFWHFKAWRMKLGPEELVNAIFTLHKRNNYEAIGIEKTTFTVGLKPYLDMEQRRRNVFLPIVELEHQQKKKEIRIRGLIPRYAAGSIFHIDGECKDLEEEQFQFPNGLHDDTIDAAAYQLQLADAPTLNIVGGGSVSVTVPDYD